MDEKQGEAMDYTVIIERDGEAFSAHFPDVPGCFSAGDTYEEVYRKSRIALEEHLAALRDLGKPLPEPKSRAATVSVKAS